MRKMWMPLLAACLGACGADPVAGSSAGLEPQFQGYWYAGKAEISRYDLRQSRYGEVREGDMVLIFVTEDLRRDTQVKAEVAELTGESVAVLKLNRIQRFVTGIYDYSLMQSVFVPVDRQRDAHALKVTASLQDWCGHTWLQLNRRGAAYQVTGHSYFEREGEASYEVPVTWLEDEVWALIRMGCGHLPVGEIDLVAGSFDACLRHHDVTAERVTATLQPLAADGDVGSRWSYQLAWADASRRLEWQFEQAFPHGILLWREVVVADGRELVTEARRSHVVMSDYWDRKSLADLPSRETIGLSRRVR